MRLLMIILVLFCNMQTNSYTKDMIYVENIVNGLYITSFRDYLKSDNNYNLKIDEEKLKGYMIENGIDIEFFESDTFISFELSFKTFNKKYEYYMVKNYG